MRERFRESHVHRARGPKRLRTDQPVDRTFGAALESRRSLEPELKRFFFFFPCVCVSVAVLTNPGHAGGPTGKVQGRRHRRTRRERAWRHGNDGRTWGDSRRQGGTGRAEVRSPNRGKLLVATEPPHLKKIAIATPMRWVLVAYPPPLPPLVACSGSAWFCGGERPPGFPSG